MGDLAAGEQNRRSALSNQSRIPPARFDLPSSDCDHERLPLADEDDEPLASQANPEHFDEG
jgi:hypothetical protein